MRSIPKMKTPFTLFSMDWFFDFCDFWGFKTQSHKKSLLAFRSSYDLKHEVLRQIKLEIAQDRLLHYYQFGDCPNYTYRGCPTSTSIEALNLVARSRFSTDGFDSFVRCFRIPLELTRLYQFFRDTPRDETGDDWVVSFLRAITPGADLSMVWLKFAHWLLVDPDYGMISKAKAERLKKGLSECAELYARWIAGEKPSPRECCNVGCFDGAPHYISCIASHSFPVAKAIAAIRDTEDAVDAAPFADRQAARLAQSQKLIELLKESK